MVLLHTLCRFSNRLFCDVIVTPKTNPHYGPRVNSASNRNEYQESSWGKGWPVHKADNLTTIFELIVYKMWEPRHLTTLWASMACYRDSLTFFYPEDGCGWFLQNIGNYLLEYTAS
jgi:hypothetical protein